MQAINLDNAFRCMWNVEHCPSGTLSRKGSDPQHKTQLITAMEQKQLYTVRLISGQIGEQKWLHGLDRPGFYAEIQLYFAQCGKKNFCNLAMWRHIFG